MTTSGRLPENSSGSIAETSTLSAAGSPVRTSARSTQRRKALGAKGRACGKNTSASFARFDLRSSRLRTYQRSLFGGWTPFCATLPRAGLMLRGTLYRQMRSVPPSKVKGFSYWPRPTASDSRRMGFSAENHRVQQARNKTNGFGSGPASGNLVLHCHLDFGGVPTANFVEWLMGFPIGWTDIEPSETP